MFVVNIPKMSLAHSALVWQTWALRLIIQKFLALTFDARIKYLKFSLINREIINFPRYYRLCLMWNFYWYLSCPRKFHGGALLMLNLGCKCCEKQNLLIKDQAPMGMRARRGGTCPQPSWNLKMMTSYASLLWNTLKFSLAPSALAIKTLTRSLKCRKSATNFLLRLRRPEKQSTF